MMINSEELKQALAQAQNIAVQRQIDELEKSGFADKPAPEDVWEKIQEKAAAMRRPAFMRRPFRIAMVLALVIFIGGTSFVCVGVARGWFSNWTGVQSEKEDTFHFSKVGEKKAPVNIETRYEIKNLPEGMERIKVEENKILRSVAYLRGKEYIQFQQYILDSGISIDSEGLTRETVEINGCKGQMNYKKGKVVLMWSTADYAFCIAINGDIPKETAIEMAKSVAPEE